MHSLKTLSLENCTSYKERELLSLVQQPLGKPQVLHDPPSLKGLDGT